LRAVRSGQDAAGIRLPAGFSPAAPQGCGTAATKPHHRYHKSRYFVGINPVPMRAVFLLAALLLFHIAPAQGLKEQIRASARPLATPAYVPDTLLRAFRPFRVVMVGEMHGTRESALFAGALAEAFARSGDSVLLGIEIPEAEIGSFSAQRSEASLLASPFFQGINGDGRNSAAWKELLLTASKNPRIGLIFFDQKGPTRDSMMAVNILRAMEEHPGWKVVTLSGNMHNKVRLYNGRPMAGRYLLEGAGRDLAGRLCAINIAYQNIAMWADMGDGLKLHTGKSDNIYAQAAPSENSLLFLDPRSEYDYNAVLFVKNVTASPPAPLR
jgi:hypothetical protein